MQRWIPVAALTLTACNLSGPVELHGSAMGTTWTVTFAEPLDAAAARSAEASIRSALSEAETVLSSWDASSEISAFNRHDGTGWVPVSEALYAVLEAGRTINQQSGGAFDLTVAPLVALWGFGPSASKGSAPSNREIADALRRVGADMLELQIAPRAARKHAPGVRLDLDAIAPGLVVDRISRDLAALGYPDHIVEIGGEVRCQGRGPGGRAWRIAIERPQTGARIVQAVVALDDLGISSSGDYRDFRVFEGRRISHTIDPRSGRPVRHALASVSVVHESVMLADAYATALMVLGPEEGYELAERLELAALFIVRAHDGFSVRATTSFDRLRVGEHDLPHGAHY
jgi:FAD:protein FMN transferase